MTNGGYIYVLINASMNGLVKVGKTTRDPQGRAQELSNATGVPTPFVLAFKAYFEDCTSAEGYIHGLLEQQGYRVSPNREFFNAPLSDVIESIISAQSALDPSAGEQPPDGNLRTAGPKSDWEDVYLQAEDSYYGLGDTLQDHAEALKLFKQAILLGGVTAYRQVGIMYRYGKGCRASSDKALDYFKQGVNKGDDRCWAEMALLFSDRLKNENSQKCWERYFQSKGFRGDEPNDGLFNRLYYSLEYICSLGANGPVPTSISAQLSMIIDELLKVATERFEEANATKGAVTDFWTYKHAIQRIELLRKELSF